MFLNQQESVAELAVKSTPVALAGGLNFMGITLPELIQYLSAFYAFLLAVDKLYLMFLRYREARRAALKEIKDEPKE